MAIMDVTSMLGLGYIFSQIPWTVIFLLTPLIGIRLYVINDKEDCKRIQKRIGHRCSHTADGNKGFGYSLGFWYFMSITLNEEDYDTRYSIWLVATEASYKRLIEEKVVVTAESEAIPKTSLRIYDRMGSFHNSYFKQRELELPTIEPRPVQDVIIQRIKEHQDKHQHTVVYLHGPPGTGKSLVGILLTNDYMGSYCNTLRPWQPGETLSQLYSEVEPTSDAPLVVVFDEFDSALLHIHEGIPLHKNLPTEISNKTGWNHMLDTIQRGMYPHLILILTSNKTPDFICSLDSSYIREGRVDITVELA